MLCDGLFQLGMGPVVLDATQTEDISGTRPLWARGVHLRTCHDGASVLARATMPPFAKFRKRCGAEAPMTLAEAVVVIPS